VGDPRVWTFSGRAGLDAVRTGAVCCRRSRPRWASGPMRWPRSGAGGALTETPQGNCAGFALRRAPPSAVGAAGAVSDVVRRASDADDVRRRGRRQSPGAPRDRLALTFAPSRCATSKTIGSSSTDSAESAPCLSRARAATRLRRVYSFHKTAKATVRCSGRGPGEKEGIRELICW